jgi:hypothetical protein
MILTYTILNFGDLLGSQLTSVLILWFDEVVVMVVAELIILLTVLYAIFMVPEVKQLSGASESFLGLCSFHY